MMNKHLTLALAALLLTGFLTAPALTTEGPSESQKVWVYFTNKQIDSGREMQTRLQEVAARLDEHAVARRLKALGPQLVDEHDLPVSSVYVAGVEGCGATVVHRSRWLNAVSVRATATVQSRIEALAFVDRITPVAQGRSVRHRASEAVVAPPAPSSRDAFDYGPSRDQRSHSA